MKTIILIGGAPGIGKTTTAKELARHLKTTTISTDEIRAQMRIYEDKQKHPALFALDKKVIQCPAEFFDAIGIDSLLEIIEQECREVWRGVLKKIQEKTTEEQLIIEGAAILPEQSALLEKHNENVRAIILVNNNSAFIKHTIYNRGIGGPPELFSEKLKSKQRKWVKLSNHKYEQQALKYKVEIFDVNDPECISKIIAAIN